jgi:nucleoid-associated protein YgaU
MNSTEIGAGIAIAPLVAIAVALLMSPIRSGRLIRAWWLIGLTAALASPAHAAPRVRRSSDAPAGVEPAEGFAPPWSGPDGFSPPHPSGLVGVSPPSGVAGSRSGPSLPASSSRTGIAAPKDDRGPAVYTVRRGDSLWSIAAQILGTEDARRIARYWPLIHRANRGVIGPNPDLIMPGQRLRLPSEPGS